LKVTFQVEKWSDCIAELRPIYDLLWADVAIDKDRFKARCNEPMYKTMEDNGFLHLVTARFGKALVGCFQMTLIVNGHYADAGVMAFTDLYFLAPAFRKGSMGIQLFRFAEKYAKSKGCEKFYTSHKIHRDHSSLMKLLGFKPTDMIYSKVIA
jgi:hypothetical protein